MMVPRHSNGNVLMIPSPDRDGSLKSTDNAPNPPQAFLEESNPIRSRMWLSVGAFIYVSTMAAIAVSAVVVKNQHDEQASEQVQETLEGLALQMEAAIQLNTETILDEYKTWVSSISSELSSWPFATLSNFESQADAFRRTTKATQVSLNPLVHESQRKTWEAYAIDNYLEWIQESYEFHDFEEPIPDMIPFIHHDQQQPRRAVEPVPDTGNYYAPFWQVSPILENQPLVNFDAYTEASLQRVLEQSTRLISPVLSQPFELNDVSSSSVESILVVPIQDSGGRLEAFLLARIPWGQFFDNIVASEPIIVVISVLCQNTTFSYEVDGRNQATFLGLGELMDGEFSGVPVQLGDSVSLEQDCEPVVRVYPSAEFAATYSDPPSALPLILWVLFGISVAGFLIGLYFVHRKGCFQNADSELMKNQEGSSNNGEVPEAAFEVVHGHELGNSNFARDDDFSESLIDSTIASGEMHQERAPVMQSQPQTASSLCEEQSTTNFDTIQEPQLRPSYSPTSVGAARQPIESKIVEFSLGGHDQEIITHKHRSPQKQANNFRNDEIIKAKIKQSLRSSSSPSPASTRMGSDQLTQDKLTKARIKGESKPSVMPPAAARGEQHYSTEEQTDKPIADLYPDCTVMFADLAGFTSWSSHRVPLQVFTLLETLFNAFDRISICHGVFKVETIGDCYVAATGVPIQNKNHAVAMAKFARECVVVTQQIMDGLQMKLGDGTADLAMRIGLHSGPVTGGVLRGEKSRFQLYGDTIDIANKIESLGERNKIHLSEQTMLCLLESGKDCWIEQRTSAVELEGQGLVQSYWLTLGSSLRMNHPSEGHLTYNGDDSDDQLHVPNGGSVDDYNLHESSLDFGTLNQLAEEVGMSSGEDGSPIARLFDSATLMFAEVYGFTVWSRSKQPYQVFMLLERLWKSLDKIAKRRAIFKIETIGACYLCSAGLPFPRPDHAIAMARFAREVMVAAEQLFHDLDGMLDTKELKMRVGLHSGPVTAGVLRGDKCRFQVFGDTVNTTARIETLGEKGKIHLSENCAELLKYAGKDSWLSQRDDLIEAKGKGKLQTYWLALMSQLGPKRGASICVYTASYNSQGNHMDVGTGIEDVSISGIEDVAVSATNEKMYGLIDSIVDILERLVRKVVATRSQNDSDLESRKTLTFTRNTNQAKAMDELLNIIPLPKDRPEYKLSPASVHLDETVLKQLRDFVSVLAYLYRTENHYHAFEHASFVTESMNRLLARAMIPERIEYIGMPEEDRAAAQNMEEYTHKIVSSPMVQFALVFAALIQDADHSGVGNKRLEVENKELASRYKDRCIAEQHALKISWDIFMEPSYDTLRECLFRTQEDVDLFRQVVVNAVMATAIFDKQLKCERETRWKTCFFNGNTTSASQFSISSLNSLDDVDLKATLVMEYMMQATNIAHTLQQFNVFVAWNEKMFLEEYEAFNNGRSDVDSSADWYFSELRFFDSYVLPVANKIAECGLFGYNGAEYLRNAKRNKTEWEMKGQALVSGYVESYERMLRKTPTR